MGGELLNRLMKQGRFPEPIARHVVLQVVQAMMYCHARGVIHRDLKLENVLLKSTVDDDYTIKIIDFGIAGLGGERVD